MCYLVTTQKLNWPSDWGDCVEVPLSIAILQLPVEDLDGKWSLIYNPCCCFSNRYPYCQQLYTCSWNRLARAYKKLGWGWRMLSSQYCGYVFFQQVQRPGKWSLCHPPSIVADPSSSSSGDLQPNSLTPDLIGSIGEQTAILKSNCTFGRT